MQSGGSGGARGAAGAVVSARNPEARAGYYNRLKIPAGWAVAHTGGNCTALQRDYYDPPTPNPTHTRIGSAMITDDASVPDRASDPCTLGIYDREDRAVLYFNCRNLREAVMIAARVFVEGGIGAASNVAGAGALE